MNKSDVIIKFAEVADSEEILNLQKLAYRDEAKIYNDCLFPPSKEILKNIRDAIKTIVFLKAVIGERIVGSVRSHLKGESCRIERLIVHPDFQNYGIGTKLMNEIEAAAEKAERFELSTADKSRKNNYFYKKLNYIMYKTEKMSEGLTLVHFEKYRKRRSGSDFFL